ncbi:hypothetical protein KDJ21_012345 [Metabacillus litoralis]|uniref:hypothetical protein n=1 Tax=Metabacillus TaxID=2675233 RepID=UPI001BA1969B|nr:hypothetical protein [Metabacillus litoralis]UHA62334.1 hypothetical protein KDJ21_012345 [Metabacillus litoralis]
MIEWRKKHTIIIVLTLVLSSLVVYFSYLLFIKPKAQQIDSLQSQIETENTLIQTLQKSSAGSTSNEAMLSAVELQKILPVSPFEEQFLLDLEKAETISNSMITSLTFQESEEVTAEEEGDELVEAYEEKLDPDAEKDNAAETSQEVKTEPMPEGLEKLTVELTVTSPSYYELEDFIRILENSKRITQIESVSVEGNPEFVHLLEDSEETDYEYNVVVSTFYLPSLEELREQLPPIFTPEPSDKQNPFTNAIEEEDEDQS